MNLIQCTTKKFSIEIDRTGNYFQFTLIKIGQECQFSQLSQELHF